MDCKVQNMGGNERSWLVQPVRHQMADRETGGGEHGRKEIDAANIFPSSQVYDWKQVLCVNE